MRADYQLMKEWQSDSKLQQQQKQKKAIIIIASPTKRTQLN